MRKLLMAFSVAAILCIVGRQVNAVPLLVDTGWQEFFFSDVDDTVTFQFTLFSPAFLRGTDGGIAGDEFSVQVDGGPVLNSSVFAGPPLAQLDASGLVHSFYEPGWESLSYHSFETQLSPGIYTATIVTQTVDATPGGVPTGLGFRLDTAIPEPATATLVVLGLGGLFMRRRRTV